MSEANRDLLAKAQMTVADLTTGGYLTQEQAKTFMKIAIKNSELLRQVSVIPLKSPNQAVNKIKFSQRVLRPGREGVPLPEADRSKPETSRLEHDAKLFRGEVVLTDELLEDNIEGERLKQTVVTLMGEAVQRDMEDLVTNGDVTSANPALAEFDGIRKQISSHVVNAGNNTLAQGILRDLLKTMPSQFLRNKRQMRFFTSTDAEIDYRDTLTARETALGDAALGSNGSGDDIGVGYGGVLVKAIPLYPENLGGGSNNTEVIFSDPKNFEVGIWRQVKVKTTEDIRSGKVIIVVTLRMDVVVLEEDATAKAINVRVGA